MGPQDLAQVLGNLQPFSDDRIVIDFHGHDDAAVVRLDDGRLLVQTVDFFTPVVDDPYQFGQIAAANSLSDIYAMGAIPIVALNIVGFPINELPKEMLTTILQGGADKAREAGISIVGGHSIDDKEPKYGLVVTGEVKEKHLVTNSGAQPGDRLILTKPLGTGIIATAVKRGLATDETIATTVQSMSQLNKLAAELMSDSNVHAATDVTGFGLLGHLLEMCQGSKVSARINFSALSFFPAVTELAQQGIFPGGTKRNLAYVSACTHFDQQLSDVQQLMLADAQTSGGLLLSFPPEFATRFLSSFNKQSPISAVEIGDIIELDKKSIYVRP